MKKYLKKLLAFGIPSLIFLPLIASAQGLVPCSGTDCNFDSIIQLVNNAINYFLTIAASVAAVTFAIAGGKMLLNPNNPGERTKAKSMFKNTIIGLIIVLCAWLAVYTVIKWIAPNADYALRFLSK